MRTRYRVFVTDGYWRKSVAAVRSLGQAGHWVAVGERTRFAPGLYSRYRNLRVVYPDPRRDEDGFVRAVAEVVRRHRIQVVLPMEEDTLLLLLRRQDELPGTCRIPFAAPERIEEVRDKGRLLRVAAGAGIPTPRTREPTSTEEAVESAAALGYPVVVKPRVGSGARGIVYVEGLDELPGAWRGASAVGRPALLQERLPREGEGIGVSALCVDGGEAIALFSHRRLREYPATGGSSTARESVRAPVLEARTRALLRALDWRGVGMVEYKKDERSGEYLLLEMNPRFWGSLSLPVRAGVDFPDLLCRVAMGEAVEPVREYRLGVRGRTLLPGDLLHFLQTPRRDWRGFFSLAGRSVHFDFCSMDDPAPGVARLAALIPAVRGGWWNETRPAEERWQEAGS